MQNQARALPSPTHTANLEIESVQAQNSFAMNIVSDSADAEGLAPSLGSSRLYKFERKLAALRLDKGGNS